MDNTSKKTKVGKVVSDKMDKTAIVEIEVWKSGRVIKKRYKRHSRFMSTNPDNQYKIGDLVVIAETKPLSRHKRWEIIGLAKKEDAQ